MEERNTAGRADPTDSFGSKPSDRTCVSGLAIRDDLRDLGSRRLLSSSNGLPPPTTAKPTDASLTRSVKLPHPYIGRSSAGMKTKREEPSTRVCSEESGCAFSESVSAPISDIRVIRTQRSSRFSPRIAMVKAAYARQSDDLGVRRRSILNSSSGRRVAETGMDPFSVVILDVLA